MKLNMANAVRNADARRRVRPTAFDQLITGARKAVELRRIGTVAQIQTDRAHRRLIPNAEPNRVHHIIEIRDIALVVAEAHVADVGINIAHIVKQNAAYIVADQRET